LAKAAKEDDLLEVGGIRIAEEEQTVLIEIAQLLGFSDYTTPPNEDPK
jgi:hypothetical protein